MTPPRLADRFRGFLPVAVDVETGGFDHRQHALLEIAAVTLTMDDSGLLIPGERLAVGVVPDPELVIEQAALDFTGIDPQDPWRQAEPEREALTQIFELVRKAVREQECLSLIHI